MKEGVTVRAVPVCLSSVLAATRQSTAGVDSAASRQSTSGVDRAAPRPSTFRVDRADLRTRHGPHEGAPLRPPVRGPRGHDREGAPPFGSDGRRECDLLSQERHPFVGLGGVLDPGAGGGLLGVPQLAPLGPRVARVATAVGGPRHGGDPRALAGAAAASRPAAPGARAAGFRPVAGTEGARASAFVDAEAGGGTGDACAGAESEAGAGCPQPVASGLRERRGPPSTSGRLPLVFGVRI